ncbi:lysophospholipid acyltransferase family protein [Seonamhaeicola sp. MEBiC1930]|uniref:lysophospholipid acyltransferase family protein n=1 Tax=Seonamhaeicola sp. MEBiC01930 TaxID=2976768 RepID=UPI003248DD52
MQFLIYIIVYPLLWGISKLPFRLLYLISDGLFILMYYFIGYRKEVVTSNLRLVFPQIPENELKAIRKKFYRHLCDMFLEMAKTMSMSETSLKKRFLVTNPEEFKRLEQKNKSILLMYGHYASWEWSLILQQYISFKGFGVYKKLANKHFDKLVRDIRSKFNTQLISTKETISAITNSESENVKSITAFISDQSPRVTKDVYWQSFMGVTVPCYTGAERLAKKLDLNIAYLKIDKIKRGHYRGEIVTLVENPKAYNDFEITDLFLKEVEKQIYHAPEYYFWTHKRWKHKDKKPS